METKTQTSRSTKQTGKNEKKPIVINRVLNLPIDKVWNAWSDPEEIKKWWGPENYTCPSSEIDFRVGGKYLHCMRSSAGEEFWGTGVYKEIIPGKKQVFTDSFADENGNVIPASAYNMPGDWPSELLITLTFEEDGEKTKLKMQHEGIPDEMRDDCIKGWNESLDKLERNIE